MQRFHLLLCIFLITPGISLFAGEPVTATVYKMYQERGIKASPEQSNEENALEECSMESSRQLRVKRKLNLLADLFLPCVHLNAGNLVLTVGIAYPVPFVNNIQLLFPKHNFW